MLKPVLAVSWYDRIMTQRFLIFGLLGPLGTYLGICAVLRGMSPRWADLPLAYEIELIPFLLCASIEGWLKEAPAWERVIVSGSIGFIASAVALGIASSLLFPRSG